MRGTTDPISGHAEHDSHNAKAGHSLHLEGPPTVAGVHCEHLSRFGTVIGTIDHNVDTFVMYRTWFYLRDRPSEGGWTSRQRPRSRTFIHDTSTDSARSALVRLGLLLRPRSTTVLHHTYANPACSSRVIYFFLRYIRAVMEGGGG